MENWSFLNFMKYVVFIYKNCDAWYAQISHNATERASQGQVYF